MAVALATSACDVIRASETADAATADARHADAKPAVRGVGDNETSGVRDIGDNETWGDATGDSSIDYGDAGYAEGGGYLDAGWYRGDGSYFVDGGTAADVVTVVDASLPDATVLTHPDASPGCTALAACCGSLSSSTRSLCTTVAGLGSATNCATELAELESGGSCTGVTVLTSDVPWGPASLVSDGTTLFWTANTSGGSAPFGLYAMPVGGGAIKTLLDDDSVYEVLSVDDLNLYIVRGGIVRLPKNGGAPSFISEAGAAIAGIATLGGTAYWLECTQLAHSAGAWVTCSLKSAVMASGPVSRLARFEAVGALGPLGVTGNAVFFANQSGAQYFPIAGTAPADVKTITGPRCYAFASDTNPVYCSQSSLASNYGYSIPPGFYGGANLSLASDGTTTTLGPAVNSSVPVVDETYVYWSSDTAVGTITKAPKAGGAAAVIAHDVYPGVVAVDAHAVYWGDFGGSIKRMAK